MASLNRDGVNLHYEIHGNGPAILLTHGFSATGRMWEGQVEALSRSHKLILWDVRGHGESDSPPDPAAYSQAATVEDMAAILDAAGVDRAVIGGLSMGGFMTLSFHSRFPERTAGLLIIDCGPGFKSDEARAGWNEYARGLATQLETEGLGLLQSRGPEAASSIHRSAAGLTNAARGMLIQRNAAVIESLPGIGVPALVVVGAEDKPFLNAAEYMARKIPGASKVVIDGAGHAVNIDQPAAFNAAVLEFLERMGW